MKPKYILLILSLIAFISCTQTPSRTALDPSPYALGAQPYTRYWWFASMIQEEDIRYNLDWLKANGFGGIELAWVYPLNRFNPEDTTYTPRQEWLSPEWQEVVRFTIAYADSIGLGCDLTFGTLWPFGDTDVTFDQATQRYGDPDWRQQIRLSWQHPKVGYVVDHLSPENYQPYFDRLLKTFPRPRTSIPQCYFIDSWEVETERLWCDGFGEDFRTRYGYDIVPYMDSIYECGYGEYLYDYMSLVSEKVLKFYADFDSTLNSVGIFSRGQVSGAPCDLISGYALLDIPEGESMLFEPEFCAIPASAALLSGKRYVSSETFTCLYGWPRDYIREEQTADLKLVADALFANGINRIIWHGKSHNPAGYDTVSFYATTHIGSSGMLSEELPEFNRYLEKMSSFMARGHTYSDIAVYLPVEDAWTAGVMPKEQQFKWAWGHYEMRYVYFPEELDGFCPAWINGEFLQKATFDNGLLKVGNAEFKALYMDAEYLEYSTLKRLVELTGDGLSIILKKVPQEPGMKKHEDYGLLIERLNDFRTIFDHVPSDIIPFITGNEIPRHWCRQEGEALYVFFPNPKADRLKFPIAYGQSLDSLTEEYDVSLNYKGKKMDLKLILEPYQSLLFKLESGKAEQIDIHFVPKTPVFRKRPEDYKAPWLVN